MDMNAVLSFQLRCHYYLGYHGYRDVKKLELLQELNISGNQLRSLPAAVGQLPRLVVLRAHSNMLHSLPDFKLATALRVKKCGSSHCCN